MATLDLSAKTVVELRKLAKENGVTLGAGVNKEAIIAKLTQALSSAAEQPAPATPVETAAPVAEEPVMETQAPAESQPRPEAAPQQTQYRAAWHNPGPRYNSKPAYQAPAYQQRQNNTAWQGNRPAAADPVRPAQTRPVNNGFTPRFGPAAREDAVPQQPRQEEEYRPYRQEQSVRTGFGPGAPERRPYGEAAPRTYENAQRPAYENQRTLSDPGYDTAAYQPPRQTYEQRQPGYDQRPRYDQRPAYTAPRRENNYYAPQPQQEALPNPAVNELLTAGECLDGSGVLELHPEGYGFLRSDNFLPSSKDIYVSMAQIRRFGLRTGDYVVGKTRPQRDGDKYTAMLYINEINGVSPDAASGRPLFDELTPVYPTRRINLEAHDLPHQDMRLIDLIAPLGFGQRALLLCPPETGKTGLLKDFANVIARNHPEATVMVLLLDETPEDVTAFRDAVDCTVLASTFDQPPENHLRLVDVVQSRAERLVEQGKDVVLIVDSLTRLAKVYTTAALQGRSTPGMVNPSSLFRAKKLFGSARCMKEGGSLTIIAAMNVETGSKVDDSVVEEFKGTANMELLLDASIARAGVRPAINLPMSGTKRAEALLDRSQMEGLQLIRSIMASTRSVTAIPQLLSMLEMATTNDELLVKIKDWTQLMNK